MKSLFSLFVLLVAADASTPRVPVHYPAYVDNLPSMVGKTVAIIGCSRGLGFVTARTCAAKGARVMMLNRESPRAREALAEVAAVATGLPPEHVVCDLLDLSSVRTAAEIIRGSETLDVICLNGGTTQRLLFDFEERHLASVCDGVGRRRARLRRDTPHRAGIMFAADLPSQDGFDQTMATNLLSHFLLTSLLMPLLETTAAARGDSRVVSMSSGSGFYGAPFDAKYYEPGSGGNLGGEEGAGDRYHQSKLGQFLFTAEFDKRLHARGSRVKSISVHARRLRDGHV